MKAEYAVLGLRGGYSNYLTNKDVEDHDPSYLACERYDAHPRLFPGLRRPRCVNPPPECLRQLRCTYKVDDNEDDDEAAPEYGHHETETEKCQCNEDGRGHRRGHRHKCHGVSTQIGTSLCQPLCTARNLTPPALC